MNYATISDTTLALAAKHLADEPVIGGLIPRYGICTIRPHRDYYRELVESIIGQQLSVKAAASINRRFVELFDGEFPDAETIFNQTVEYLREAGLSGAKARYVQDLAARVLEGKLEFEDFDAMSNEAIARELTAVKGIGQWTADMFLMFCMGRLDVLPVGDLGIKNGVMKLYELESLPGPEEIRAIATKNNWAPYQSVASWYIWQSLDNAPKA